MDFDDIPTVDVSNIDNLERKTTDVSSALGKHIEQLQSGIAQKRARLEADMEMRLRRTNQEDRGTLRALLQRDVEQELAQTRRDVVTLGETDRRDMLSQLANAETQLAALESLHKSPQQVLARSHSGDNKKASHLQILPHGGPAALQTHAELAIATGDRALASAVLIANDNMQRKSRPFSSAKFAEAVLGDEVKATTQKIAVLRDRIATALELERAFVRGNDSPLSKLERGLRQRGLAA